MTPLLAVNWGALGQVALVTILATCLIVSLVVFSNWCFTPDEGLAESSPGKRVAGWGALVLVGLVGLFGLWLIIPYFPKPW
ncbi:MAG: hypothetical protein LBN10_02820 [Propionibacteriaceae bacterium]|jgi:hypothetical protein|nr:hypothetical protein [Propionibacteriaceae bacterium]